MTGKEDGSLHRIAMKMYKRRGEIVLAACDREVLGHTYEDGELHITVKKDFYYESYVSDATFLNSLRMATIANLVGKHVIEIAVREGYIDEESVIEIDGVPHAQMFLI